jgi:hypothetical protein
MVRRPILLSAAFAFALLVTCGQVAAAYRIKAGPIQNRTYTDKAVICFETIAPSAYILQWGELGGAMDQTEAGNTTATSAPNEPVYHWARAEITGLDPDTAYTYDLLVAESGGAGTDSFTGGRFRTAPTAARPFSFAVFGDSRGDPSWGPARANWVNVSARMDGDPNIEFAIGTGDFIGEAWDAQQWEVQFFGPGRAFLAHNPFHQAIGNHDYLTGSQPSVPRFYRDIFDTPGSMWYTFTYGPARFICLDTCGPTSSQTTWVQQTLSAATEQYIFVAAHHPAFSMGPHGTLGADGLPAEYHVRLFLQQIVPLLEQYKVTAAFVAHDHFYERSFKDGVHHVLSGGGGTGLYSQTDWDGNPSPPEQNPYFVLWARLHHYCRVNVDFVQATMEVIDVNGNVIDTVTMAPRYEVIPIPPEITAWYSAADHARGIGEVMLDIPDDGSFCEPRGAGLGRLIVQFSEAMDPGSFTPDCVEIAGLDSNNQPVDLSGLVVGTHLRDNDEAGVITFTDALPDCARYAVRLGGVTDTTGLELTGDTDRVLTALCGDVSGDLRVNATDFSRVRGARTRLIDPASVDQVRADVSCDGRVNAIDLSRIRRRRPNDASGIADPALALARAGKGVKLARRDAVPGPGAQTSGP